MLGAKIITRIFQTLGSPQSNFSVVATHVRHNEAGTSFVLRDQTKLEAVVGKWGFEGKDALLSRCGYDYQLVATNGEVVIRADICFACRTLVLNHREKFAISKREILWLLAEDFEPIS